MCIRESFTDEFELLNSLNCLKIIKTTKYVKKTPPAATTSPIFLFFLMSSSLYSLPCHCFPSLGSFPSPWTVYPDFDSCYSHFMPYRMTPSVRHRAIEVHYYYYYSRRSFTTSSFFATQITQPRFYSNIAHQSMLLNVFISHCPLDKPIFQTRCFPSHIKIAQIPPLIKKPKFKQERSVKWQANF